MLIDPTKPIREVELGTIPRKRKRKRRFETGFSVYLQRADYLEFAERAAAENHSVSRYARRCLLRSQRRARPARVQKAILGALHLAFAEIRQLMLELEPGSSKAKRAEAILGALQRLRVNLRQGGQQMMAKHQKK